MCEQDKSGLKTRLDEYQDQNKHLSGVVADLKSGKQEDSQCQNDLDNVRT